jgi:transcriptional regulator with XRE-family HTH domain
MTGHRKIPIDRVEVWMLVKDPQKLVVLMALAGLSVRRLALLAGWKSHSYLARVLRGEVNTMRVEPAARIAHALGVDVDEIFVSKMTINGGQLDNQLKAS